MASPENQSRSVLLLSLVTRLGNLDAVKMCTIHYTQPDGVARERTPHIAVVPGREVVLAESAEDVRYLLTIHCFLMTNYDIEHILDDIKNLIDGIDRSSMCESCRMTGNMSVCLKDLAGKNCPALQIDLSLIYVRRKVSTK